MLPDLEALCVSIAFGLQKCEHACRPLGLGSEVGIIWISTDFPQILPIHDSSGSHGVICTWP